MLKNLLFRLSLVRQALVKKEMSVMLFVVLVVFFNINLHSALIDSFIVSAKAKDIWPPSKVTDLVVENVDLKLKLTWTSPTENSGLPTLSPVQGYYIGYSTLPLENFVSNTTSWWNSASKIMINYASSPGHKEVFITPSIFSNNTTYYFAIRSYDDAEVPNLSPISDIVKIITKFNDGTTPRCVVGLESVFSSDMKMVTFSWSKVTKNTDGSDCTDLYEYRIYRSDLLDGEYVLRGRVSADLETLMWQDSENFRAKTYFYYVTAVDIYGNESDRCLILKVGEDKNIIITEKEDHLTKVVVPYSQNNLLVERTNKYKENIKIVIERDKSSENGQVLKSYSVVAKFALTNKVANNFVFDKPVKLTFYFGNTNNSVLKKSISENNLSIKDISIFWYNGLEWLKLGGDVDPYFKTISINTTRLGKYMVKLSVRSGSFEILGTQPDKIFTPNNDGWNDFFEIRYDNPKDATVVGKIYDLKGRYVADMKKGFTENTLIWDGKDLDGNLVSGGIYVYQIEVSGAEKKVLTGTCVVAK